MKEIDLYTDYGFEDDDRYAFLSVNSKDEIEFKVSAPNAFMHMLLLNPSLDGNGFKGITKIWQEDLLFETENGIIEVTNLDEKIGFTGIMVTHDLDEAKADIEFYNVNTNIGETKALYHAIIDIIEYSIINKNKLYISVE